jgi:hypothetical protein
MNVEFFLQESPKFQLCETLSRVVSSLHGAKDKLDVDPWSTDIYHGLSDILKSRIGKSLGMAIQVTYGRAWLWRCNKKAARVDDPSDLITRVDCLRARKPETAGQGAFGPETFRS